MSNIVDLPTELLAQIIHSLDAASTAAFAFTNKTIHAHVNYTYSSANLSSIAPTLTVGRGAMLRQTCQNQWLIEHLAQSTTATKEWDAAYRSFFTLVLNDGCEVCRHVLFKYELRTGMGKSWSLCPDRLDFYRRAKRNRHQCNNANGCLAEMWRSQAPRSASGTNENPEEEKTSDEAKVREIRHCSEHEFRRDGSAGHATLTTSPPVVLRRSKRLMRSQSRSDRPSKRVRA